MKKIGYKLSHATKIAQPQVRRANPSRGRNPVYHPFGPFYPEFLQHAWYHIGRDEFTFQNGRGAFWLYPNFGFENWQTLFNSSDPGETLRLIFYRPVGDPRGYSQVFGAPSDADFNF